MKIALIGIFTIGIIGCAGTHSKLGLFRILLMNQREFTAIKKISIDDAQGFKFVKTSLKENKFKTAAKATHKKVINDEDKEKINAILKKY